MADTHILLFRATVSGTYGTGDTSITLDSTARLDGNLPLNLNVYKTNSGTPIDAYENGHFEVWRVTAVNTGTNVITVSRAQEGTSAIVIDSDNWVAYQAVNPKSLSDKTEEAPNDGSRYARKNEGWESIVSPIAANISEITEFTATDGQTTFSVTYTVDQILVFVNGALLKTDDYTATNGTSIVLDTAAEAGDIISVIEYISVAEADSVAQAINGVAEKTSLVDADKIGIVDSEDTNSLKWWSFANIKANLKTYFDTIYHRFAQSDTGTLITFNTPRVWNSPASPGTGNITNDLTNAKIRTVQKIYHNDTTEPTFPAGWVRLNEDQDYVPNTLNIIFAEWVSGTRVEYWFPTTDTPTIDDIDTLTEKTSLVDGDSFAINDSEASDGAKKTLFSTLRTELLESEYGSRLIAYDTFVQTDGARAALDSGQSWTNATMNTVNNEGDPQGNCIVALSIASHFSIYYDVYHNAGSDGGLIVSWQDDSNYFYINHDFNRFRIFKVEAGSATQLADTFNSSNTRIGYYKKVMFTFEQVTSNGGLLASSPGFSAIAYPLTAGERTNFLAGLGNIGFRGTTADKYKNLIVVDNS